MKNGLLKKQQSVFAYKVFFRMQNRICRQPKIFKIMSEGINFLALYDDIIDELNIYAESGFRVVNNIEKQHMRDMEVICMYVESLKGINTQTTTKTAVPKSTEKSKKAESAKTESKKTESIDELGKQVQIAEADEAVTLSIMADEQLVDDQKNVNLDRLKKIMEQVTAALPHSEAKFGIHEKTNRITIKLVDRDTHEVIKEIPPEKSLDLIAKRMELAGVMVDEKL